MMGKVASFLLKRLFGLRTMKKVHQVFYLKDFFDFIGFGSLASPEAEESRDH